MKKNDQSHNGIRHFALAPLKEPKFVHTALAHYEQDGIPKSWEVVKAHDSVAILIYHTQKESFVLVKQFRPAVYIHNHDGMTVELCAGIVDKALPLEEIAREEIEEECGYRVPIEKMARVTSFYTSVGFAGSVQTLYYAEVDESMRVSDGGGIEGEKIEVITLPLKDAKVWMFDESVAKTPGLLFAFMWWLDKYNKKASS